MRGFADKPDAAPNRRIPVLTVDPRFWHTRWHAPVERDVVKRATSPSLGFTTPVAGAAGAPRSEQFVRASFAMPARLEAQMRILNAQPALGPMAANRSGYVSPRCHVP